MKRYMYLCSPAFPDHISLLHTDLGASRFLLTQVTVQNKEGETVAEMQVPVDRYIFFAFEDAEQHLPLHNAKRMCRNGCCTTCAALVKSGSSKLEAGLGLTKDLKKEGYTLLCCTYAKSDLVVELQDEDEVYIKQWGDSFESGGVEWGGVLPEED